MNTYRVRVTKRRTGETFEGVTTDDGLQSLFTVQTADGVRYASVLDSIERITPRSYNGDDLILAAEWAEFEKNGW